MDNIVLEKISAAPQNRQYWVKQWGDPQREADFELQSTTDAEIPVDFSKQPNSIKIGDIVILHRIKLAKIMFIAEVVSEPLKSTATDIKREYWRERWCWRIETRNLTPEYGCCWKEFSLKTFALADEYNETNPNDFVNVGRLNFGAHVRVSADFAHFVFKKIILLS